jgi:hypothetical protein
VVDEGSRVRKVTRKPLGVVFVRVIFAGRGRDHGRVGGTAVPGRADVVITSVEVDAVAVRVAGRSAAIDELR